MDTMNSSNIRAQNSLIPEGSSSDRCAELLADTLNNHKGIVAAQLDLIDAVLSLDYNPHLIDLERVNQIGSELGIRLSNHDSDCHFRLSGSRCADCSDILERKVRGLLGVTASFVNEDVGVLSLVNTDSEVPHIDVARAIVNLSRDVLSKATKPIKKAPLREQLQPLFVATTLVALLLGILARALGETELAIGLLAVVSYFTGGIFGLIDGVSAIRERQINVDLLMILAAIGAALIGSWPEGATLLFLFSFSNLLQSYALDRSRKAIEKLLDLRPRVANVLQDGSEIEVDVEQLQIGQFVLIRPGEAIPVDGIVVRGESSVDQASITGESVPVEKQEGAQVFAGTVNQHGALEVRVTKRASDTTLARIISMVEEAQARRAPTQRFIDTFEQYYAITVIAVVTLFIAIPVLVFNQPFAPTFYQGMVLLVVASPCALVISTPASILSAIANAARKGILFKGGVHLENAATIRVVAFDKTGTLTYGQPRVTDIVPLDRLNSVEFLQLIASAEARSEHPLAQAIVREAKQQSLELTPATEFQAFPGLGVSADVNADTVLVGSMRFMEQGGHAVPSEIKEQVNDLELSGKTVLLAHRGTWLGLLGVADKVRPEARTAVEALRRAGIQRVIMLTGDNERAAQAIANQVGVDEVHASLLPEDKVKVIEQLQAEYGSVAMVGDGVNDAPALATASIGIAMGAAGTDVALETADIVLMSDDLHNLAYLIRLSRQARRVVWQNLTFAISVILLLIAGTFGLFGETLPLPLGVVGHEGSTVIVVLNGLRLLAFNSRRH
jgi:Zn2+/Cd2+-exporting ATPase